MIQNGSIHYPAKDVAFVALLKALANRRDLCSAYKVHADILRCGLHILNVFIGSALVSLYTRCNTLAKAQQVFDELPYPNIVTWNALMTGYAQHGHSQQVFNCYGQLKAKGVPPDGVTYLCILKACGSIKAVEKGAEIHNQIADQGWLRKNTVLGSALVDMYAKCGALEKAQEVFDELPIQNVISWTGLISGYVQYGQGHKAFACFKRMQDDGFSPNSFTFSCILKACGEIGATEKGKEIHDEIARKGLLGKDVVLATALVDMYVKHGALERARVVLEEIPLRDVGLWNALITGYCEHGHGEEALDSFEQMKNEGISPDALTYSLALKACGITKAAEKGREIHDDIIIKETWRKYTIIRIALVDMYAKCGLLAKAQQAFDEIPIWDTVLWNALISGYCQVGHYEDALECFERMKCEGPSPDVVTFACIVKACSSIGSAEKGEDLYAQIVKEELLKDYSVLGSALVDMFAKFGALARAEEVLNKLPIRDVVSWTALISGYCQHGHGEEAIDCFEKMKRDGCSPDAVTFACVLKACGNIGAVKKGEEVHAEIAREGLLGRVCVIGNALVDMYAKCGALVKAHEVFDKLPIQDKVCWTSLIAGCCQHGYGEEALHHFERMKGKLLTPDAVTFACILKACGSIGAAEKGQMYFESMTSTYGIPPTIEHHTCMVGLFSKVGHLDKAVAVVNSMAVPHSGWSALISACQKRGNVKLGSLAFQYAVGPDGNCNDYVAADMVKERDVTDPSMQAGNWVINLAGRSFGSTGLDYANNYVY